MLNSIPHSRAKFNNFRIIVTNISEIDIFGRFYIVFAVDVSCHCYACRQGVFILHIVIICAGGDDPGGFDDIRTGFAQYIIRKQNAVCAHDKVCLESSAFEFVKVGVSAVPQLAAVVVIP